MIKVRPIRLLNEICKIFVFCLFYLGDVPLPILLVEAEHHGESETVLVSCFVNPESIVVVLGEVLLELLQFFRLRGDVLFGGTILGKLAHLVHHSLYVLSLDLGIEI